MMFWFAQPAQSGLGSASRQSKMQVPSVQASAHVRVELEHGAPGYAVTGLDRHVEHDPQSVGQLEHDSDDAHVPSPHDAGHEPQSVGQVEHDSDDAHSPSPHDAGHDPQSEGQLTHDSDEPQVPSPQVKTIPPESSGRVPAS